MSQRRWILVLAIFIILMIIPFRHYFFYELPRFSGEYKVGLTERGKMADDSIDFLSHRFIDEMKARAGDRTISEDTYLKIEKELSVCVKHSVIGKNTDHLKLQQFIDMYFKPCAETFALNPD